VSSLGNIAALHEFDDEPVHGLPEPLPPEERVLWQGSPRTDALAREAFHVRGVCAYFVLLALWQGGSALAAGEGAVAALTAAAWVIPPAAIALGLLWGLAWGYARGTVYTLTDRRIVFRSGLALTMAIDVPLGLVDGAALRSNGDGSGDIALSISPKQRCSWLLLWPNVRPWRLKAPQPQLRAIPEANLVAALLTRELRHAPESAPAATGPALVGAAG
jgi:hypothetical protein